MTRPGRRPNLVERGGAGARGEITLYTAGKRFNDLSRTGSIVRHARFPLGDDWEDVYSNIVGAAQMNAMNSVFFQPWQGDNYSSGFQGRRVLVLGESHYQWDEAKPAYEELTKDCIREQINGEHSKFWTNIAITFLNANPDPNAKRSFWHSIAFYNYVQCFASFGPRVSPSQEMWSKSEPAFWEVLESLRPHNVIALGSRLFDHLPEVGERGPNIEGAPLEWTWWYPVGSSGFRTLVYAIRHPSAGFNGRQWHPYAMTALELTSGSG